MLTISTGNNAVAAAVRKVKPAVVAAYPITPQTEIVEQIAQYVADGSLDTWYIPVESEHSAMAACIGASFTGCRTFTATSSHGLLYMNEMVNWAAGARLPIVMANVNRALGPGWNVWADHTDSLQARDSGWLQVYVSTVQEVYDTVIMAFRIAEDRRVYLPVMVNLDGFILSHITQQLYVSEIDGFLSPMELDHRISFENPKGYGCLTGPDDYCRFRFDIERSMRDSISVIRETQRAFEEQFRRSYGFTDEYRCDDATVLVISLGTLGKEAEVAVDLLRKEGIAAGCMRIRWFCPFPSLDIRDRELVVIDRDYSFGSGGILADTIRAKTKKDCFSVIAGLGGQEVSFHDIAAFVRDRRIGEEFWFGVDA